MTHSDDPDSSSVSLRKAKAKDKVTANDKRESHRNQVRVRVLVVPESESESESLLQEHQRKKKTEIPFVLQYCKTKSGWGSKFESSENNPNKCVEYIICDMNMHAVPPVFIALFRCHGRIKNLMEM